MTNKSMHSKPYSIDKVKPIHGKEFSLINLPFFLIGKFAERIGCYCRRIKSLFCILK